LPPGSPFVTAPSLRFAEPRQDVRVALDVTPELAGSTGVARYSRELGKALEQRDDCDVVRFALGRGDRPMDSGCRRLRVPLRILHPMWRIVGFPGAEWLTGAVDVVHSLDLHAPPTRSALVMTVHDTVAVELPRLHSRRTVRMQRRRLAELRRAHAIVAVSHSTADALGSLGIERERVHVACNGLTPLPRPVDPPVPDRDFILVVGTLEPRKGHAVLLQAFASAGIPDTGLVFAGPTAGRAPELTALAARLGLGDRVTILGRVDDGVLAGLYRDATLLCMPSLAEGFGLPVLEAMAAGLPVLASELPAVREVAGEAAVVFPAGDMEALAAALQRSLADPELRESLRAAGISRASRFTWEAAAEATVRAYNCALAVAG
jgi:glycosyltransferase involved in cell wall biosynthesis